MIKLLEGFCCLPLFLLSSFFFIPVLWQLKQSPWEKEDECVHAYGKELGNSCQDSYCVKDAVQFGFNMDHLCSVVSTRGQESKPVPKFFSSQLFYPTCRKASKMQVSSELIFLCSRVTSNSERLLTGGCHIGNARGRLHATMCLYLWGTEENPASSCCHLLTLPAVSSWWNLLLTSRCCWVLRESVSHRKENVSLWLVAQCAVILDICFPSLEKLQIQKIRIVPGDNMIIIVMECRLQSSGWIWVVTDAPGIVPQS